MTWLLASCCGKHNDAGQGTGGLVLVNTDTNGARVIDRLDSTGMAWGLGKLWRFVRRLGWLWAYDEAGLVVYKLRLPSIVNGHDVAIDANGLHVVAAGSNSIHAYDFTGYNWAVKSYPGHLDAWHLNCLTRARGELWVTAFGKFAEHRGWKGNDAGCGFLMSYTTGEIILGDLSEPHSPRLIDGRWYLCESMLGALLIYDGERGRRVQLQGYTRGLAYDDARLYVGESRLRDHAGGGATVAILDRENLTVEKRISLPMPEIYELVIIPSGMAEGLLVEGRE